MKKIVRFVFVSLLIGGCTLQQDPLADKSDKLKQTTPVSPKPGEPTESDLLQFRLPNTIVFLENSEATFKLESYVKKDGYLEPEIVISNIDQFPGAHFDPKTGELIWKPDANYIEDGLGKFANLEIRAFAYPEKKDGVILTKSVVKEILVQRVPETPSITMVSGIDSSLREGDIKYFEVTIYDKYSGSSNDDVPLLQFDSNVKTAVNLASFIKVSQVTADLQKKEWKYSLQVNLRNIELTAKKVNFSLEFWAANKYGRKSPLSSFTGVIFNKLIKPKSTWEDQVLLKPGVPAKITFLVYDSKGEGVLEYLEGQSKLPTNASLACAGRGPLVCDFTYTPVGQVDQVREEFSFSVNSHSQSSDDTEFLQENFTHIFYIEALPKPNPRAAKFVKGGSHD